MTEASINGKKPKFFTTPIADSGTKTDIPATGGDDTVSQQQGFPSKFSTPRGSGGKSVGRSDMNGLFNGVSSLNYYFQYMGRNPWTQNDATGYPKGAKVWYNDAEYVSTSDGNTTTPGSSATWIKLNDLSGTSGGGSTVDCAWSSRASEIGGLLENAGKIPSITSDISSLKQSVSGLSGAVSGLSGSVSSLKSSVDGMSTKINTLQSSINVLKAGVSFSLDGFSGYNYVHMNFSGTSSASLAPTVMALPGWIAMCPGKLYNSGNHSLEGTAAIDIDGLYEQVFVTLPTCYIPAGAKIRYIESDTYKCDTAMIKYDFTGVTFPSTASKSYTLTTLSGISNKTVSSSDTNWHLASSSKLSKIKVTIPAYTGSGWAAYAIFIGQNSETVGGHGVFIQGTIPSSGGVGLYPRTYPTAAGTLEFVVPANHYYGIASNGTAGYQSSLSVSEYVRSN